jgi:quercetin dioxygenase-like cupin family protein
MRVLNHLKLASAVALGLAALIAHAQDSGRTVTPAELQWKPSPRVKGLEIADVIGDAAKPGPYVQRVKFPPNFTVQAHSHPEDRQYTIISGTWYVGWGDKFDETRLKALPAGGFYTEPANVPHFVTTKGESVTVQITGTGPTAVKYVAPADAPKKQ